MEPYFSMKETDNFYINKEEPNRSCLLALRSILLDLDPQINETLKWRIPCFSYKKKMFCFFNVDKKTKSPYLLMVGGKYLHFPELEVGTRSRMKILRINPEEDLPIELVRSILNEALNLYKNGK